MGTVAFNANEVLDEGTQDKKKFELNDKAKAAMAAGVVGAAAGAAGKAAYDAINKETVEDPVSEPENQDVHATSTSHHESHAESSESATASVVNPDDVMLEEPVLESAEEDLVAEDVTAIEENPEYQPFANNDVIEDVVYEGPLPDEPLYAEDLNAVLETGDVTVDLICGEPYITEEQNDELLYHPDDQYAWEPEHYDEPDIQTDLMA